MKIISFLLFFIATPVSMFSQPYMYQSAEIYKRNKVKTRTTDVHAIIVDHFDKEGLLIEIDYFTYKKVFFARHEFEYDTAQNLVKEIYYYIRSDSTALAAGKITDTLETKIEHDSKGRVTKKTFRDWYFKLVNEKIYTYDPYTVTEQGDNFFPKNSRVVKFSQFDDKGNETMIQDTRILSNGDTTENTFKYYENIYDKSGNLKKRIIKTTPTIFDSSYDYSSSYSVEHTFSYTKQGLLADSKYKLANGYEGRQSFTYEFW